ncbi:MAG TPA: hypothetical protein VEU54_11015 [Steroidobacteraceae bacterium]|nr:hypothetical protein [Steroidobacteraceae bacterium]
MREALTLGAGSLAALVASLALAEQAKHPITHADVWLMKRIGAPAVSPDGRLAVVSVTEPAYDRKDQLAQLWLVPTDGKGLQTGVSWCSDGSTGTR